MTVRRISSLLRRGTAADWAASDPILHPGEFGIEIAEDGSFIAEKCGDGDTPWSELAYTDGSSADPTDPHWHSLTLDATDIEALFTNWNQSGFSVNYIAIDADGGDFTLSVDGDETDPIDLSTISGSVVESALSNAGHSATVDDESGLPFPLLYRIVFDDPFSSFAQDFSNLTGVRATYASTTGMWTPAVILPAAGGRTYHLPVSGVVHVRRSDVGSGANFSLFESFQPRVLIGWGDETVPAGIIGEDAGEQVPLLVPRLPTALSSLDPVKVDGSAASFHDTYAALLPVSSIFGTAQGLNPLNGATSWTQAAIEDQPLTVWFDQAFYNGAASSITVRVLCSTINGAPPA